MLRPTYFNVIVSNKPIYLFWRDDVTPLTVIFLVLFVSTFMNSEYIILPYVLSSLYLKLDIIYTHLCIRWDTQFSFPTRVQFVILLFKFFSIFFFISLKERGGFSFFYLLPIPVITNYSLVKKLKLLITYLKLQ